jgi:CheY-like chemotaxis protein/two-component sensor histidine kinase
MLAYAGKGRFVLGPVHLSTMARSHAVALQATLPTALRLRLDLAPEVPIIEADPAQLRQVLTNLVPNAVEAMTGGEGSITVRTGVVAVDRAYLLDTVLPQGLQEGRYVFLEVNDTGEGIPPGIQERIFEPFFSTRFTGRGLGLAAVVGIVRHLGGTIRLESAPGRGTTVRVLFPTGAASQAAASRPIAPAPEEATVLLVDHEAELVRLMQRFLVRAGFRVRTASGSEETMEEFRAERHRLTAVVVDLTGKAARDQTLAAIRGLDPEIPIVVTSGYSEAEVAGQIAGVGVSAFLPKPYLPAELIDEVRRAITAARARPPGNRVPESR